MRRLTLGCYMPMCFEDTVLVLFGGKTTVWTGGSEAIISNVRGHP